MKGWNTMLNSPVLVVLAAGMGSRYGGLKQIDKMDDCGNTLINFSLYDAFKAGFDDVLFIIRHDIEKDFREAMDGKLNFFRNVEYVYQDLDNLPDGINKPENRNKPYGTTHALYCCKDKLQGKQFLTINADDFYGYNSYKLAYDFLKENNDDNVHAIIGYEIAGTLTDAGHVSRGVCIEDENHVLQRIDERKKIKLHDGCGYFTLDDVNYTKIPEDAVSSMNMWAFNRGFIDDIKDSFVSRLAEGLRTDPLKFEETITDAVKAMMDDGKCSVKVVHTDETWFGVTYKEDKPKVKASIADLRNKGKYPEMIDWINLRR